MGILPERKLYRRLMIAGFLLAVVMCAAAGWVISTRGTLQGRIAAIRAAGHPATIADLAPQAFPPEEEDAAAQLAAVAGRVEAFSRELGRFYKTPLGIAYDQRQDRGEAATGEQLDAIRKIIEKFPDVDSAIDRAAACRQYASRLNYQLPQPQFLESMHPGPIDIRAVARFIVWQMKLAIGEGRTEVALEHGIELLRLAALYDAAEPGLVSSQMANAVRGVAAAEIYEALVANGESIAPALRQELDNELARFDVAEVLRRSITTERACVVSATQYQLGGMTSIVANTVGLPMKIMYIESIDVIEPMLAIVDEPWYVTFQPGKPNVFQPAANSGVLASLLAPSFKAQFDMVHRTSATLRALRVVNALQRYADEHGREAGGLVDLNLPPEATTDPFSGKPLTVRPTDRGWVVYSVGVNGIDDGGNFEKEKDVGFGITTSPATSEEEASEEK